MIFPIRSVWAKVSLRPSASTMKDSAPNAQPTTLPLDQGEFYWADGRQISLVRRAHQIAVKWKTVISATTLMPPNREFTGYTAAFTLTPSLAIYTVDTSSLSAGKATEPPALTSAPDVAWVAPVYQATGADTWAIVSDEIIVALKPGVTPAAFFTGDHRFSSYQPLLGTPDQYLATVAAGGGMPTLALANLLQSDPRLRWASPNFYQDVRPQFIPNDPLLPWQWHLHNTGQLTTTVDADADIVEAWEITTGSPNVIIAIIDDGIQLDHPDLAANIFVNPGELADNGIDDDGNGWIDDVRGWDFAQNDPGATPASIINNHGTAVAGVAAAVGQNGLGTAGVAYGSRILPVRIGLGREHVGDAAIATAIYYAAGRTADGLGTWRGADILNNSWGGGLPTTALTEAITWASTQGRGGKGTVLFFASGNRGERNLDYPARLASSVSGVVAVGASTDADLRANYSSYGAALDLVAPSAGGIYGIGTTDRTGAAGYGAGDYIFGPTGFSGTSSASPLAAGVGALLLARDPDLTAAQVRALLRATADKIGPQPYRDGFSEEYGFGRINARAALDHVGDRFREIRVTVDGYTFVAGDTLPFGKMDIGESKLITIQVTNIGTADLSLGAITLAPGPFTLAQGFTRNTLPAFESTTFTIHFAPTVMAPVTRTLSFTNNDDNETPFALTLTGAAYVPSLQGHIFLDWNANGVRDPGDRAASTPVYLDLNNNGKWDLSDGEPYIWSDKEGAYRFTDLAPGAYVVRQRDDLHVTLPTAAFYSVTLATPQTIITELDFGLIFKNALYGQAFADTDADGIWDAGEVGLPNQLLYLDINHNGLLDRTTFAARDLPKIITDTAMIGSKLVISSFAGTIRDLDVVVTMEHPEVADLEAWLMFQGQSYRGMKLFDNLPPGANLIDTIFDDEALLAYIDGQAPFTGRFRPLVGLDYFHTYAPNGQWELQIKDKVGSSNLSGILVGWALAISSDDVTASNATGNFSFFNAPADNYVIRTIEPPGWRVTTPASGVYTGALSAGGFFLQQNFGFAETIVPTVQIAPVTPPLRNTPVETVTLTFSEPVTGFDLADLELQQDDRPLLLNGATVIGAAQHYTVTGLATLTGRDGLYRLTLNADNADITDRAGNPLMTRSSTAWTLDTTPPVASLVDGSSGTLALDAINYTFQVRYTDAITVDVASLIAALQVVGPQGFSPNATLLNVESAIGSIVTARYQVTPPRGVWDEADNGLYTIQLLGNQVQDVVGNCTAAAQLGSFTIQLQEPSTTQSQKIYLPFVSTQ